MPSLQRWKTLFQSFLLTSALLTLILLLGSLPGQVKVVHADESKEQRDQLWAKALKDQSGAIDAHFAVMRPTFRALLRLKKTLKKEAERLNKARKKIENTRNSEDSEFIWTPNKNNTQTWTNSLYDSLTIKDERLELTLYNTTEALEQLGLDKQNKTVQLTIIYKATASHEETKRAEKILKKLRRLRVEALINQGKAESLTFECFSVFEKNKEIRKSREGKIAFLNLKLTQLAIDKARKNLEADLICALESQCTILSMEATCYKAIKGKGLGIEVGKKALDLLEGLALSKNRIQQNRVAKRAREEYSKLLDKMRAAEIFQRRSNEAVKQMKIVAKAFIASSAGLITSNSIQHLSRFRDRLEPLSKAAEENLANYEKIVNQLERCLEHLEEGIKSQKLIWGRTTADTLMKRALLFAAVSKQRKALKSWRAAINKQQEYALEQLEKTSPTYLTFGYDNGTNELVVKNLACGCPEKDERPTFSEVLALGRSVESSRRHLCF